MIGRHNHCNKMAKIPSGYPADLKMIKAFGC
nr:MAG TPA_asm: hypothetical protein [Caudoviricetes sp.]DAL37929.1 MAG TPA_asm: hypothetical protein [Caudoviricetes sp.]